MPQIITDTSVAFYYEYYSENTKDILQIKFTEDLLISADNRT